MEFEVKWELGTYCSLIATVPHTFTDIPGKGVKTLKIKYSYYSGVSLQ